MNREDGASENVDPKDAANLFSASSLHLDESSGAARASSTLHTIASRSCARLSSKSLLGS